jgi:hypothetical protein
MRPLLDRGIRRRTRRQVREAAPFQHFAISAGLLIW